MSANGKFSENTRINILIENILDELCPFLEEQAKEISELTAIGKALGTGKDIKAVLEMILSIAQRFTKADGGTLYLVDHKTRTLNFNVIHNESLNIKKGGGSMNLPGVPLYNDDNTPNYSNVSSYVFHTGEPVNIRDVYKTKRFQFDGIRKFDQALNYKSKSMIVIPMRNHENEIIGILQLINSKDLSSGKTIAFNNDDQEKAMALASQASVILTQQFLIMEMEKLFKAFIKAIALSIDEKSKHTAGHIQRVTELCIMIAEQINLDTTIFKDTYLSPDQIDELRIAALMHDTGKITTPEYIISKSTRLETVHDRIELIKTRWELFKTNQKLIAAQKKLALFNQNSKQKQISQINMDCKEKINILEKEFKILCRINSSKEFIGKDLIRQVKKIYDKSVKLNGISYPYLTKDEFENLCVTNGTLTLKERNIIKNHAHLTQKILSKLPWPKKFARIPDIAGAHHEKLDGSGYPLHLKADKLNIQARILAIADVFEALSAKDRPYKEPINLSKIVKILKQMSKAGHLDKEIVKLFLKSGTHLEYAKNHLLQSQIDI